VFIPLTFDPDAVWVPKQVHHVHGTIGSCHVRASVEPFDGGYAIALGPAWRRDREVTVGQTVDVVLEPEGPQRDGLAEDLAAALAADPAAGAFFDSLAQFYRRAYLRWIDGATRRPELRAERIAQVVAWLAAGIKERPKQ
jgi:NADPH:quinone reductase-like Zn-dependent oxidoreductase